jgi:hypothetical protein
MLFSSGCKLRFSCSETLVDILHIEPNRHTHLNVKVRHFIHNGHWRILNSILQYFHSQSNLLHKSFYLLFLWLSKMLIYILNLLVSKAPFLKVLHPKQVPYNYNFISKRCHIEHNLIHAHIFSWVEGLNLFILMLNINLLD